MNQNTVLYVEDEESDVFFVRCAFEILGASYCLRVVRHVAEALDYLAGRHRYADRQRYPLPGLVLLDLKLPGARGFEVLDWIRREPRFQTLPVVIFTASDLEMDRSASTERGANDYIIKPTNMNHVPEILAPILKRYLHQCPGEREAA